MQRQLYKELWVLRFQKMLRLEEESIVGYQKLLEECQKKSEGGLELQNDLKKLITDEKRHAKLVQELLNIVRREEE